MDNSSHFPNLSSTILTCKLKIYSINRNELNQMHNVYIVICLINCISAFFAFLGNGMVVTAVLKTPTLHSPSNILLCGLASSDLLTGGVSQPIYIIYNIAAIRYRQIYCTASTTAYLTGYFLSGLSFLVLTLINVDRLLALQFPMRYIELMTTRRIMLTISLCFTFAGILLVLPLIGENDAFRTVVAIVISVSIAINAFACFGIFRVIRKHEERIDTEKQLSIRFRHDIGASFKKHKKASRTTMCISALYFVCYAPYLGVAFALAVSGEDNVSLSVRIAWNIAATTVFLNSSFNPILYCYRIREIREAVKKLLKGTFSK